MNENIKAGADIHAGDGGYEIGTKEGYEAFVAKRMQNDLIYRLRKRAEIRRQITTRKSVQENKPDRIADLLEEAANEIESLRSRVSSTLHNAGCANDYQDILSTEDCVLDALDTLGKDSAPR